MGTPWAVTIAAEDGVAARKAAEAALDEVARLEGLLSEWTPTSEISRVNQNAGVSPQHVSKELLACVLASQEVSRWSNGAFDISWASLRDLWDFSPDSQHVPPTKAQVKARLPLWNYHLIQVDEAAQTVYLEKKGMQIGLGGIAKGYALDRLGEILRARGFHDFLAFAGGQILVGGKRGDRLWRVGIQHPRKNDYFGFIEASDCSIATSGDYEHSYEYQGHRYHHIIDPKTGFPNERSASVTVIAPTALWADAVDTALFIMGPERALEALPKAPGGPIDAVIVDPELRVHVSEGAKSKVLLRYELAADGKLIAPMPRDVPPKHL
jgi:thiamine biosynthesis lipoprotein